MSYSRWSTSIWYTFWTAQSPTCNFRWPTKQLRNAQLFEICGVPSYTISYGEIIEKGIPAILHEIHEYYNQPYSTSLLEAWDDQARPLYVPHQVPAVNYTDEEMQELGQYIANFVSDVEHTFRFSNFITKYWWYPFRYVKFNQCKDKIRHIYNKFNGKELYERF